MVHVYLGRPDTQKRENATRNSMRRPRRTRVAQLAISYAYVQKNFHSSRFHVIFLYFCSRRTSSGTRSQLRGRTLEDKTAGDCREIKCRRSDLV